MSKRYFNIPLSLEASAYFESCARIRNLMPGPLLAKTLELIAAETMLGNILDDDAKPEHRKPGGRGFRERVV